MEGDKRTMLQNTMTHTSSYDDDKHNYIDSKFPCTFVETPSSYEDKNMSKKMSSDLTFIHAEHISESTLPSHKGIRKELQKQELTISSICTNRSKKNAFNSDNNGDITKPSPTHSSIPHRRQYTLYNMGSALLAGSGLFHSWMLFLPMLVLVQTSHYNFIRLLLSTMFILYFTKWSPYYKLYRLVYWIISLLRYRRVEKFCDKCERQLLQQLNHHDDEFSIQNDTSSAEKSVSTPKEKLVKQTCNVENLGGNDNPPTKEITVTSSNLVAQTQLVKRPQQLGWRLRGWRRFPWRVFSRNWGRLANTQFYPQCINTFLIWLYANGFGCNVDEAEFKWTEYRTLGHFFTRKLKPGIRPISNAGLLVSPADGTITHYGQFKGGFLEQVKGSHYSLNYFLGLQKAAGRNNMNGNDNLETSHASTSEKSVASSLLHKKDGSTVLMQMIIYLSPGDYHRFHSAADWSVSYRRHFPGELLSVKPSVAGYVPGLFHLNERVSWFGDWKHGFFSMTAVAATNVGDIIEDGVDDADKGDLQAADNFKTNRAWGLKRDCTFIGTCAQAGKKMLYYSEKKFEKPRVYKKGDPFGHFNFGSTIVLLFEAPKDGDMQYVMKPNDKVKFGETIYM